MEKTVAGSGASLRAVTTLATLGGIGEFYDFTLAGVASALVWPSIFFPSSSPAAGFALSISTYGVAFLMQPVGAYIFGHLGDRHGRRLPLVLTLVLMGIGALGIAGTPTYASVGVLAPSLIVLFRALQGVGFGGEFAGSSTWVVESAADTKRRSFFAGWISVARSAGAILSAGLFYGLSASMSRTEFFNIGWRLLFVAGAAVAIAGVLIRYRFSRDRLFEEVKAGGQIAGQPPVAVVREKWRTVLELAGATMGVGVIVTTLLSSFTLNYLTKAGFTITVAAGLLVLGRLPELVITPVAAHLSDRWGRKAVLVSGTALCLPTVAAMYTLLGSGTQALAVLGIFLIGGTSAYTYSAVPALLAESFPTKYRYSGSSIAFIIPVVVGGIVTTFVIPFLLTATGGTLKAAPYVALIIVVLLLVSLISAVVLKETKSADLRAA